MVDGSGYTRGGAGVLMSNAAHWCKAGGCMVQGVSLWVGGVCCKQEHGLLTVILAVRQSSVQHAQMVTMGMDVCV